MQIYSYKFIQHYQGYHRGANHPETIQHCGNCRVQSSNFSAYPLEMAKFLFLNIGLEEKFNSQFLTFQHVQN